MDSSPSSSSSCHQTSCAHQKKSSRALRRAAVTTVAILSTLALAAVILQLSARLDARAALSSLNLFSLLSQKTHAEPTRAPRASMAARGVHYPPATDFSQQMMEEPSSFGAKLAQIDNSTQKVRYGLDMHQAMYQAQQDGEEPEPGQSSEDSCRLSVFSSDIPLEDRCAYVKTHEGCSNNVYLRMMYCSFLARHEWQWLWFVVMTLWLLFLLYLLGSTADEYFSPSLIVISDYLKLSPNVAGVTLLALGNGSADISGTLVGMLQGSSEVGVGLPIGAGLFIVVFVFGCVTLLSKDQVVVARRPFLRDAGFYLLAVCFFLYLYIDQKVAIWEALCLLLLYVLYVIAVVGGRALRQRYKKWKARRRTANDKKRIEAEAASQLRKLRMKQEQQKKTRLNDSIVSTEESPLMINIEEEFGVEVSDEEESSDSSDDEEVAAQSSGWFARPSYISESASLAGHDVPATPSPRGRKEVLFLPHIGIVTRGQGLDGKRHAVVVRDYFRHGDVPLSEHDERSYHTTLNRHGHGHGHVHRHSTMVNLFASPSKVQFESNFFAAANGDDDDQDDDEVDAAPHRTSEDYIIGSPNTPYFYRAHATFQPSDEEDSWDETRTTGKKKTSHVLKNNKILQLLSRSIRSSVSKFLESIEWHERGFLSRICFILFEGFCTLIRNLTIPRADPLEWNRGFAAAVPLFSPLVILLAINPSLLWFMIGGVFPLVLIPLGLGAVCSILVLCTARRKRPPFYFVIFVVYAFFMSIIWIYMAASQVISVLSALGVGFGISSSLLAITVLAWANSIGDLIADVSVARSGFANMAISACFGSALLNMLLGLGLSFVGRIVLGLEKADVPWRCAQLDFQPHVVVMFIAIILSLSITLIAVPIMSCIANKRRSSGDSGRKRNAKKFVIPRPYALVMFSIYATSLIVSILAAFIPEIGNFFLSWSSIGRGCKWLA